MRDHERPGTDYEDRGRARLRVERFRIEVASILRCDIGSAGTLTLALGQIHATSDLRVFEATSDNRLG